MASGKNHDKGVILVTPVVFGVTALVTRDLALSIGVSSAHLLGGLFLSPDLDCPSRPYYRWGILRCMWAPYQLIPHRHFLSHGVIVGSCTRLIYLLVIVFGLLLAVDTYSAHINIDWNIVKMFTVKQENRRLLIWLFAGVEVSAWVHLFLDNIFGLLPHKVYKKLT